MKIESLVYTIDDIKILRNCGRDKAYKIAKSLPHYFEGKKILVLRKEFDEDFEKIRKEAIEKYDNSCTKIYQIRKMRGGE